MKSTNTSAQSFSKRLGNRISEISKLVGGKKKLAHMVGMSESQIYRCINGSSTTTIEPLVTMAKATKTSIVWLATGEGNMMVEDITTSCDHDFTCIKSYNKQDASFSVTSNKKTTRKLAFRNQWLMLKGLSEKNLILVYAKGDSMDPTINDGDTLMVDTSNTQLSDGSIYVISINDQLVVRRIQSTLDGFTLISDNKEYDKIEISRHQATDLEVVGKVVWLDKEL